MVRVTTKLQAKSDRRGPKRLVPMARVYTARGGYSLNSQLYCKSQSSTVGVLEPFDVGLMRMRRAA